MNLHEWARDWGVSALALDDLRRRMGLLGAGTMPEIPGGRSGAGPRTSEAAVQNAVRLEASSLGLRMWRNNVGALLDARGVPVRYGLANDSPEMNKVVKSADLIGIRPVRIEPYMIGTTIGQFVSRECKKVGWTWHGDAHETAQLNWANIVLACGGDAAFCTGGGTL